MSYNCSVVECQSHVVRVRRNSEKLLLDEGLSLDRIKRIAEIYEESLRVAVEKGIPITTDVSSIIARLKALRDLSELENNDGWYCALPLTANTNAPYILAEHKGVHEDMVKRRTDVVKRDHLLLKEFVRRAGYTVYDPYDAPFNPNLVKVGGPKDIFSVDNLMVLACGGFGFTNLLGSTGAGIELRTAVTYGKLPVLFVKKGVKTSRMSTGIDKALIVEYDDLNSQGDGITALLSRLKGFERGSGHCDKHGHVVTGYSPNNINPRCLVGVFEDEFPGLVFRYS